MGNILAGVFGVVLAGGRARRMGGASKASVELAGRPLIAYPLAALRAASLGRLAVVCKRTTALPSLPAWVERWDEPDDPTHPAAGIAAALRRAARPVLVVAADMPWVEAAHCRLLLEAAAAAPSAPACVATAGRPQPVLGVYRPAAVPALTAAARAGAPLTGAVEALGPVLCELPEAALRSVDSREEALAAERELALSGGSAARSRRP